MRMVRPEFLVEVEKRIRQANSLLIIDEVLTGFGTVSYTHLTLPTTPYV